MTVGLRQQDLATTLRVNRDTLRNWGANRVLPVARYITAIDDFPSGQAY
jgi:DNA-binding transcriptional regulator YiaG